MNRKNVCIALLIATLLLAVAPLTLAHDWGCWVQPNRTVYVYNTASYFTEANNALNEWDADTILSIPRTSSHTEVSVFDGNYGNTGWGGIAEIISYSGCNITHCHARLNYYYSYTSNGKRGVFCQEFGHCLGLQHSNDGGCMGGGYYYDINTNYNVVSHNITDIGTKYANKHADGGHDGEEGAPVIDALWYDHPTTLAEARQLASAIVVARVSYVNDAEDIVLPVKGIENNEDRIPTQRVGFEVRRTLAGEIDSQIELFHTGNESFVLAGDPQYKVGETYVLFLTAREDGTYRVISPEGRFQVARGGLKPVSNEEFAQVLKTYSVQDLDRDLKEMAVSGLAK